VYLLYLFYSTCTRKLKLISAILKNERKLCHYNFAGAGGRLTGFSHMPTSKCIRKKSVTQNQTFVQHYRLISYMTLTTKNIVVTCHLLKNKVHSISAFEMTLFWKKTFVRAICEVNIQRAIYELRSWHYNNHNQSIISRFHVMNIENFILVLPTDLSIFNQRK